MKQITKHRLILWSALLVLTQGTGFSQQTIAEWNFPNNPDNTVVDNSIPVNVATTLITSGGTGAITCNQAGATTFSANCTGWDNGSLLKCWEITIATTGCSNITVSSKQNSSATGPREFKIQYQIGAGAWNDLPGATTIVVAANFTSGVVAGVALPVACENQPAISLRWIMTSNTSVGSGIVASGGNSRIDDINISWNNNHYYRSIQNGNWMSTGTWESSADNITWNPAIMSPSNFSKSIIIQNSHMVTVNSNIRLDETIIESGAELSWNSSIISITDGPGIDLIVEGTFSDNSSSSVSFSPGATWVLGSGGTIIKTNGGSANNWRDNYNGGIATIPASASWIIRKTGATNPILSSLNMYYPNLTIEHNVAGNWTAVGLSGFQGVSSNVIIKGNLDIGGTGIGTVEFENINTNVNPIAVMGTLTVKAGNSLRNFGTGFEIQGDFVCDGTIAYDATDARKLVFSGNAAQTISGTGTINIFNLIMNKSSNDLTLNRTITIDNNITFNNPGGRIFTSASNLIIIDTAATATNPNNTSFVHGPVRKLGDAAFVFPVGKDNDYQPIEMGSGIATGVVETFTAEYFKNNPATTFNNVTNPFIDHISQCEYWILNRDSGSSSRLVILSWDTNSGGITTLPDLTVARFNGLSWDDAGNGGITGTASAGTITSATVQSTYGPFTLASISDLNPLPVELIYFDVHYKNEVVEIKWTTASELNSDYFDLLRSEDGIDFEIIDRLNAAGNSISNLEYFHIDDHPLPGIAYYRLNQVDKDGKTNLSQIVSAKAIKKSGSLSIINIIPSQISNSILIKVDSGENKNAAIKIYDSSGKLVFSKTIFITDGMNSVSLEGISLKKGIYSLQLQTPEMYISSRFLF